MIIPAGTKITFKGGSFVGVLPSTVGFSGSVHVVGTGSGCVVTLEDGSSFDSSSVVTLSGGSVSGSGAFTNNGSLAISGASSVSLVTLAKGANGSTSISCASVAGTTWTLDSLTCSGGVAISTLTASGNVSVGGNASGTTWTTDDLTVAGDATITTLNASGDVSVGGEASGTTWTTGALDVEDDFDVPTLTLNGSTAVSLENVTGLTLGASGSVTIAENTTLTSLTTTAGAGIAFSSSSFLAISGALSAGSTTLTGTGYLALPDLTNESSFTQGTGADVRICQYGAGVTALTGESSDGATATLTVTKTNASKSVLLERLSGGAWVVVNRAASGSTITAAVGGTSTQYRVFDGASFTSVLVGSAVPHAWLVYTNVIDAALQAVASYNKVAQAAKTYNVTTGYIMASEYYNAGESIVLFARIENSASGALITSSGVSTIKYTCYKVKTQWGKETLTAVTGHSAVSVPLNCLLSAAVTSDSRWTKDSTGYNFQFEPDTTTNAIFPEAGQYRIVVTVTPTTGNPAPIVYDVTVN